MLFTLVILSVYFSLATSSRSWSGSNLYFLPGLSSSQQDAYLDNLQSSGAKAIRIWVNKQSPGCDKGINVANSVPELESSIGNFEPATLDAVDAVLVKLHDRGIKAIISPHDANLLQNSDRQDTYGHVYGPTNFYSDSTAASQYDSRLSYILNYTGKTSGKVWKSWTEAIMAFDIQNEPMSSDTSVCSGDDKADWMCNRAQHLRSELGGENPIKIATGGIGGDISRGCTFMPKAMQCGQIDLVSIHAYKGQQSSNPNQWSGSASGWLSSANGKLVMVEEFGTPAGSSQSDDFAAQTSDLNKAGLPWTYWQILPSKECDTIGSDTYGVYQDQTDISTPLKDAQQATAQQDWSGIIY